MNFFDFLKIKKYRQSVFIVVYKIENKKIRYLVQKRKLNWNGYEFPKGGVEKGENDIDTVKREIFEETGLLIKNIKNHHRNGKWEYEKEIKDRPGILGQKWRLYSVEAINSEVVLDKNEHSSFEWAAYSDALKKLTYDNQKECLRIVNSWVLKQIGRK